MSLPTAPTSRLLGWGWGRAKTPAIPAGPGCGPTARWVRGSPSSRGSQSSPGSAHQETEPCNGIKGWPWGASGTPICTYTYLCKGCSTLRGGEGNRFGGGLPRMAAGHQAAPHGCWCYVRHHRCAAEGQAGLALWQPFGLAAALKQIADKKCQISKRLVLPCTET